LNDVSQIIYFFGAGISNDADLPMMIELWNKFQNYINAGNSEVDKDIKQNVKIIEKIVIILYKEINIEYFLKVILDLEDNIERKKIQKLDDCTNEINYDKLKMTRRITEKFIRLELEQVNIEKLHLYKPILSLPPISYDKLKIFTLNYDGILEILCEKNGRSFSDGFTISWDHHNFDNADIQIFKMHGSLFWLSTSNNNYIKIPLKGLDLSSIKYMSDDDLSEMIIYPSLNKYKFTEIYSWLNNKLIEELNNSWICIIVEYSLRDLDIREIFANALNSNKKLWIVLVSPNALQRKNDFIKGNSFDKETSSRIVTLNAKFDIISKKELMVKLNC